MKAYTLDEAELWFTENSVGRLTCVKDGNEKSCGSYPEAKAFFTESYTESKSRDEDDDSSSGIGLGTGIAIAESLMSDSTPSIPDTSSSFDSGGGDFGGAGSGSDY